MEVSKMEQVEYMLCDEAVITSRGLLFKDNYYTCQFAVKKQLFNLGSCNDGKPVKVLYEPFSMGRILIQLEEWKYYYAYLVQEDSTMTFEEVQEYHEKLQILKDNFKRTRKRKIQRTIVAIDNNNCS
jgi:hypothetical protein